MPAWQQYGRDPYGGSTVARPGLPANAITAPGYTSIFYWVASQASSSYGGAAYGGAATFTYPSAGLAAIPDPLSGTTTVQVWWAYASDIALFRVDRDGTRTPLRVNPIVRDASLSQRNLATNPKARDALTNYTAGTNTAISRLTGLTTPSPYVTTGVRSSATAAGATALNVTDTVSAAPATFGFWARTSALVTDLRVSITWYDATNTSLGTTTYSATAGARTQAVGAWSWVTIPVTTWPGAAVFGTVAYTATGVAAGGTVDITGRLIEVGDDQGGDYFDGDYPGSSWTGTPGLSYSDTSPIVSVVDAEAPLDFPVRYEATSSRAPSFVASTDWVTLASDALRAPYDSLLTHPGQDKTVRVWIEDEPEISRKLEQGRFQVIGRRNVVVISAPQRGGGEGELTFVCESNADRARLLDMLEDGSSVLLRAPAGHGHPPNWWLSFGDVTLVQPASRSANADEVKRLRGAFTEVDRPSEATRPLVA